MKFLIYGAGVIGSIWAGKLSGSGHEVTLLARGRRLEELSKDGIILRDAYSGMTEHYTPRVIEALDEDDIYDYILVTVQRTQIDSVLPSLSRNRSPAIVCMVNTAAGYEKWLQYIPEDRFMAGFPSAGGERKDGEVEYFVGRGLIRLFQTTTFGENDGKKTERLDRLVGAFRSAGIPAECCSRMDEWQKTHVAMVTAIANALYKHGCDNYRLSRTRADVLIMIQAIQEGFRVLRRLGYPPIPRKLWYMDLPPVILTPVWRILLHTRMAEVAIARHTSVARSEMRALQYDFDELIGKAGIPTPSIDRLRAFL